MKRFIHHRKFVIADFKMSELQKAEDFLNAEYPNYALFDIYYYCIEGEHRVRYTLQRENSEAH